MADDQTMKVAKTIFQQFCDVLDARQWKYDKHEEDNVVHFMVIGEDIPMEFVVYVDADRQLVRMHSLMPFKFADDKRLEGAIVTSQANVVLADGCFEYDITDGEISFKVTTSYRDSLISNETIDYLVRCGVFVVDEFNDKFMMVSKGRMSLEQFFKEI